MFFYGKILSNNSGLIKFIAFQVVYLIKGTNQS